MLGNEGGEKVALVPKFKRLHIPGFLEKQKSKDVANCFNLVARLQRRMGRRYG